MIAHRSFLPLLEDHRGEVRAIESGWLLDALERAAIKAGFAEWCLADHVISSVCVYLGGAYAYNVVGLGRLQAAVRQALEDTGYEEIARCFETDLPRSQISLLEIARVLAPFDLPSFYGALRARVATLHRSRLTNFHFYDLTACLLYVVNHAPSTDSGGAETGIVAAIRGEIASLHWDREVCFSIT